MHFCVWHLKICDDLSQLCNVHLLLRYNTTISLNFNFNPRLLLLSATCQYEPHSGFKLTQREKNTCIAISCNSKHLKYSSKPYEINSSCRNIRLEAKAFPFDPFLV